MSAKKPALRAVGADETPDRPLTLEEAAAVGDTLAELKDLRRLNARLLSNPNILGRDFAALSRRHLEIGREIEALEARAQQDTSSVRRGDVPFDAAAI